MEQKLGRARGVLDIKGDSRPLGVQVSRPQLNPTEWVVQCHYSQKTHSKDSRFPINQGARATLEQVCLLPHTSPKCQTSLRTHAITVGCLQFLLHPTKKNPVTPCNLCLPRTIWSLPISGQKTGCNQKEQRWEIESSNSVQVSGSGDF
jgi:hypothetical protein